MSLDDFVAYLAMNHAESLVCVCALRRLTCSLHKNGATKLQTFDKCFSVSSFKHNVDRSTRLEHNIRHISALQQALSLDRHRHLQLQPRVLHLLLSETLQILAGL